MNVKVKYFGLIAEKIGCSDERLEIKPNTNLRQYFNTKYPNLKDQNYKIAVNQEFTEVLTRQAAAIEIALLPPFAGG